MLLFEPILPAKKIRRENIICIGLFFNIEIIYVIYKFLTVCGLGNGTEVDNDIF